jgi:hypothetical protein
MGDVLLSAFASTTFARRVVIGTIWAFVLWQSWNTCGLAGDGAYLLVEIVRLGGFLPYSYSPERFFTNFVGQVPVVAAIHLGVEDLHWLARWMTFGLYGLPVALYTMALARAGSDRIVLAATIAIVAMIFMTTSFAIEAEHNVAHAIATTVAVWLATSTRRTAGDGIVLVALAILAMKSYEVFIYLGPLLSVMILWTIRRASPQAALPTGLYGLAALLFVAATGLSAEAIINFDDTAYLKTELAESLEFWRNLQFDLALCSASILVAWALWRPGALRRRRPYECAGICLCLLAITPLLTIDNLLIHLRFSYYQPIARFAAGGVVAAVIVCLWAIMARTNVPAMVVLRTPEVSRHFLAFSCAMVLATLPWVITLTGIYRIYLGEVREMVSNNSGMIAFEDVPLSRSRSSQRDGWQLSYLSVLLRTKATGAFISPPRDYSGWPPPPPISALGKYVWRD